MDKERAAAKRRASFARAERVAREARQKTEQQKVEQQRKTERDKADQQRKTEAIKAAEQRAASARKRAEQRRLERHQENLRKEFARKAEDRRAQDARAGQQRKAEASHKQATERDPKHRDAAAFVAQQERRQQADQLAEHRRQTSRLRVEHQTERESFRNRQAAAIIDHARKIRNIDITERRALEALDASRRTFAGRVTGLVRGSRHFARQELAIVERHENDRWQKHRDHEAKKDGLFWTEQAVRLRQVSERAGMAKSHQTERQELSHAQERSRPQAVKNHVRAMERLAQIPVERTRQENVRPQEAFGRVAGRSLEMKR